MRSLISLAMLAIVLVANYFPGAGPQPAEPLPPSVPVVEPAKPEQETDPSPSPAPELPPEPEEPEYDYTAPVPQADAVGDEWFADAVFIGDSRTEGLRLYGSIKGADFLSHKGLSVFEVMADKPVIQTKDGKVSVFGALEEKAYGKIYLMLGLNELGYNNDTYYSNTYKAVVSKIKELQPEADLYLQLLIPVNSEVCKKHNQPDYVNNEKIAVYNEIIRTIAAEKSVYCLDVAEVFADEAGELPAKMSADGIHFQREGYTVWCEYLKTHTVQEETTR